MWNVIKLDLDIKKKNYSFVEVNQADDVCFNIKFYSNGQPLDLVDGEDTIIVNYANANSTVTGDSSIGKTMSKSGAMVYLPRNCTNSPGTAHMQITINTNKLYNANKQTTSFPLDIKIKQSVVDGKEVSKNVNSMVDAINSANIKGQQTIKNIEDTSKKYPTSSQLYSDVEDLKGREYGAENLLLDSGFLSGNIGSGFPWVAYGSTATILDSDSSVSGKMVKVVTSDTAYRGLAQKVINNRHKDYYTVSCRIKGTKGNKIRFGLSSGDSEIYTINSTDVWENVVFSINDTSHKWDGAFTMYAIETNITFYIEDVALWEGKNAFTYKYNSQECLYNRIVISGKNLWEINKSGKYRGSDCVNSPFSAGVWAYYDIDVHSSTYKKIVAWSYSSKSVYYNVLYNGTWLGWEQLTTQILAKNPANINQDSTHRFTTDTEKGVWNASVYSETKAISNGNTIKVAMKYPACKHIKIIFAITNKTVNSEFYVKVNNSTLVRTEKGGGAILEILDLYRYSGNNWMYLNTGFIKVTDGGDYKLIEHGVVSDIGNLNNVLLQCKTSSDIFEGVTAFVEYYK